MSVSTWVFGYGSLVSPASTAATIGRAVERTGGYHAATLVTYGRRWNYGSLRQRARWTSDGRTIDDGVVVSLGLERADDETANGAVIRVSDDELALLDRRESDYDRVEVTDLVDAGRALRPGEPVVTYVPRASAIHRFERARAERVAAVKTSYVALVEQAFSELGVDELERYLRTTPPPDVPVLAVDAVWLVG